MSEGENRSTIQALYRLTVPAAIPNFQPDYNVCPTDPADVVVPNEGGRDLVRMRWGLVPYWWSKPLKELRQRRCTLCRTAWWYPMIHK